MRYRFAAYFIGSFLFAASPLSADLYNHTATLLPDGNVLITGGQETETIYRSTSTLNGTAATVISMSVSRASHTATLLPTGKVLIVGGGSAGGPSNFLSTCELYDPETNAWIAAPALTTARSGHTATLLASGKVFIVGGQNTTPADLSSTEIYDPVANAWTAGPSMNQARAGHTATLLYNGEVLVAGGVQLGGTYLASAEIYDPVSNSWRVAQPMNIGRAYHSATVLANQTVLIAGGLNPNYSQPLDLLSNYTGTLEFVEAYDPHTDSWSLKAPMKERRRWHTSTLKADGTVNILGGIGNIKNQETTPGFKLASGSIPATSEVCTTPATKVDILDNGTAFVAVQATEITLSESYNGYIVSGTIAMDNGTISHTSATVNILRSSASLNGLFIVDGKISIPSLTFAISSGSVEASSCPFNPLQSGLSDLSFDVTLATVSISTMVFADQERYDLSQNQWSFGIPASARYGHSNVLMPSGNEWFTYGANENSSNTGIGSYFPVFSNASPWQSVGSMSRARSYFTATVLPNGKVLVAGGGSAADPSVVISGSEIYDPDSGQWSATGSLASPRNQHTATLLPNGRVLAVGGFSTVNGATLPVNTAEIYYPDTGVWRPTGSMGEARSNHTATLLPSGDVLVTGGYRNGQYLDTVELYISTAGTWMTLPATLPASRALHAATLLPNGSVLITGGFNGSALNTTVLYDVNARTFAAGAVMNGARYAHTATLLADGASLVVSGGNTGSGERLNHTWETYSVSGNSWSSSNGTIGTGSMDTSRYYHTTALLPSGRLLAIGGVRASGYVNKAEYLHPDLSSWTAVNLMSSARAYHGAVTLIDGNVLVMGGYNGTADLATTEKLYHNPTVPDSRRSVIDQISSTVPARGATLSIQGSNFKQSNTEASGSQGSAHSATNHTRIYIQSLDSSGSGGRGGSNDFLLNLTTYVFAMNSDWTKVDSSVSFALPASSESMPLGWYHVRVISNSAASKSKIIQVAPPKPTQAPGTPAAAVQGSSSITWTWTAPGGSFDAYNVYSSTSGVWLGTAAATATSYTQTGLIPNSEMGIRIAAYNIAGDGPSATSGTSYTAAAAPASLTFTNVTFNSAAISWSGSGNSASTVYEVSMSTDNFVLSFSSPVPFSQLSTTTTASVSNLAGNTAYYFRVRAKNGEGNLTSFSNIISTQTPLSSPVLGLTVADAGQNFINWSWTSISGIINYRVYRASDTALIGTSASNSFTQTSLSTNTAYLVRVSAVSSLGEGPLSDPVTGYTLAANPILGSIIPTNTTLSASWESSSNPSSTTYLLNLSTVSTFEAIQASESSLSTGTVFTGLTPNVLYYLRITALNQNNVQSGFQSYSPVYTLASIPANASVSGVSASKITVNWNANSNPAGTAYQVIMSTNNFTTIFSIPASFASSLTTTTLTISDLFTLTTYYFRISARNAESTETGYASTHTITTNGFAGAPSGSLALELSAGGGSSVTGTLPSGRAVSMTVPAGSFKQPLVLTISDASSFSCGGIAAGISVLTSVSAQPSLPVTLQVSYTAGEITGSAGTLVLARYDTATGACVPLESSVNTAGQTITAITNHFSTFQIMQVSPAATVDGVRIFPNPFYPNRDQGYVTFDKLPENSRVRIFTILGELVHEGFTNASGILAWRGTNSSGQPVASGVYIALIEKSGAKKMIKLAIER